MDTTIPKSHLLVTELLKNFKRKAEELTRLRAAIDKVSEEIRYGQFKPRFELVSK